MGDSGSQLIGFTLAALGLASSYTVASSTVATLVLPVLVLAVPILDTTLVTIVRLLDGRPVSQGGSDHSSHRLVSLGVSETGAVVLLALVSAALGATSLAYEAFGSGRVAAIGVLVTFALLVQFGSFLADVDRGRGTNGRISVYTRRIGEVVVDGALISASFLAAYLLRFDGIGTPNQRHFFLLTLPVLLFCRYVALLLLGMYAGVWRYASSRDALRAATAVAISGVVALGVVVLTQGALGDFSRSVFVIDAFICSIAVAAARFAERAIVRGLELTNRREGRRVLIIGAGRTGRSMLRELRETPGERVVGFIDDDPALRGRRLNGVQVIAAKPGMVLATVFVSLPLVVRAVVPVLEQTGLADRGRDRFSSYSLGMKQRLAIAATLLKSPDLLIFDEPTNGLDPAGIHEIRTTMRALGDEGRTVLVSSHILSEVEHVADRVSIIGRGRLLASGSVQDVIGRGAVSGLRVGVSDPAGATRVLVDSGLSVTPDGHLLRVDGVSDGAEITRRLAAHDLWVNELVPVRADLESVFLELTADEGLGSGGEA